MFSSWTTATAFLTSNDEIITYTIETASPAIDQSFISPPALAQNDHSISSTTFFPRQSNGFISARVIEDGYVLELKWVTLLRGSMAPGRQNVEESYFVELDNSKMDLPPVRFIFPSRIISTPFICSGEESTSVQVRMVTEEGYLYALKFTETTLFYADLGEHGEWSEEYKVISLEGRTPVLLHGVSEGSVVIACLDGFIVRVTDEARTYLEVELRSATSFSVRSLLPSFSSRNLAASLSASSPSQILSFTSSAAQGLTPFGFSVSRDRKLKIWNLETGACLRAIDLPRLPASYDDDSNGRQPVSGSSTPRKAPVLLPSAPAPFVKLINGDESSTYNSYLVLYVPAAAGSPPAFFIYGIVYSSTGAVTELASAGEKICSSTSASLVDFDVIRFDLTTPIGSIVPWNLWTLWEEGGESEIRYISLAELGGGDEDEFETEWSTIETGSTSGSTWTASHFDELLLDDTQSVVDIFVQHIFYPNRYSPSTLEYALEIYESNLLNDIDPRYLPDVFTTEYDSTAQRLIAIVGCSVQLEISPSTGAALHDLYKKKLKVEWLRFVAICNESRTAALFPIGLACSGERGMTMILMRDAVAVPILQDTILTLRRMERDEEQSNRFIALQADSLEFSYPHLSPPGIRSDVATLVSTISLFTSRIPSLVLRHLETELLSTVRSPMTQDVEDVALDLFDRHLAPYIDDDLQGSIFLELNGLLTPEASFIALWTILTTSELSRPLAENSDELSPPSDLASALLTDYLATTIEARYAVAKGLVMILLYIYGEEDGLIPQLSSLTSSTLATFHTLASLHWITQQGRGPSLDEDSATEDGILERFGEMRVTSGSTGLIHTTPVFSLLNGLLRDHYQPQLSTVHSAASSLASAASSFLAATHLITQKRLVIDAPADVSFAHRLYQLQLPDLALEFVEMYPQGAGMLYVKGLALLNLDRAIEAQEPLERAAAGLYGENLRLDDDNGLSNVLPLDISGNLARYYCHIVSLFSEYNSSYSAVAKFASLALESQSESRADDVEFDTRDLWLQLFKSHAHLGTYDAAYTTLMAIPHPDTKSSCLAHLISVMSENGAVDRLIRYSFVGLQRELEANLSFRSRNSDPFATPNYYKILYAYHMSKGDYRSAGTTMFQQARKIGELALRGGDYLELATLQCHSYLAATNALSLVEKKHAWIAVAADEELLNRSSKRRKLTSYIPEEEFDQRSKAVDIMELVDIRREYTVILSRLQLTADFPELMRSNVSLDSESVVALLSQTGEFEAAFAAAQTLDVDMSSLFETLATKCVGLSLNGLSDVDNSTWITASEEAATWEGSLASKAWRLLERHLDRYDDTTRRYRIAVLEQTLSIDRQGRIPSTLIEFFLKHEPQLLIRTMIKYGRLADAFKYSFTTIKTSTAQLPSQPTTACTWVPYNVFDTLLALSPEDSVELSSEALLSQQKALRATIEVRIAAMERETKRATRTSRPA